MFTHRQLPARDRTRTPLLSAPGAKMNRWVSSKSVEIAEGCFRPVDLFHREVAQKFNWSDQTFNSWQQHLTFGHSIEPHQCLSDKPRYVRKLSFKLLSLLLNQFTQILSIGTGESIRTEEKSVLRIYRGQMLFLEYMHLKMSTCIIS